MRCVTDLIPHRPPFLFVDRVVATSADSVTAERALTGDDPMLLGGEMSDMVLVDALAQTAACHRGEKIGVHHGYLVQIQRFVFHRRARAPELVTLIARKVGALGLLHRFELRALVKSELIAAGEMTFAVDSAPETVGTA